MVLIVLTGPFNLRTNKQTNHDLIIGPIFVFRRTDLQLHYYKPHLVTMATSCGQSVDDIEDIVTKDSHVTDLRTGNKKHVVPRPRKVKADESDDRTEVSADSVIPGTHNICFYRQRPVNSNEYPHCTTYVFMEKCGKLSVSYH